MAKRQDSKVSQAKYEIGLQKTVVTPKNGAPYVKFQAFIFIPGCPVPLEIRAASSVIEGKNVSWVTAAGSALKNLVPDPV